MVLHQYQETQARNYKHSWVEHHKRPSSTLSGQNSIPGLHLSANKIAPESI